MFYPLYDRFEELKEKVRENFENDGYIYPVLMMSNKGEILIKDGGFSTNDDKENLASFLEEQIANDCLDEFVYIAEAFSIQGEGHLDEVKEGVSIKDMDGSVEVVIVTYSSPQREISAFATLNRPDRIPPYLGEWTQYEIDARKFSTQDAKFQFLWQKVAAKESFN